MKHKRYLALIIIGVIILLALSQMNNLFYYWSKDVCTADNSILVASDILLIFMRAYIPSFLMIVFNLFMIRIVIKKSRAALRQTSKTRKEYIFTISVMANDVFFLIFDLPVSIYYILYDVNLYSGAFNNDAAFSAGYNVFGVVTKDFAFYVQSFSFFINLGFNKLYRSEICYLIGLVISIKINASGFSHNLSNIRQPTNG